MMPNLTLPVMLAQDDERHEPQWDKEEPAFDELSTPNCVPITDEQQQQQQQQLAIAEPPDDGKRRRVTFTLLDNRRHLLVFVAILLLGVFLLRPFTSRSAFDAAGTVTTTSTRSGTIPNRSHKHHHDKQKQQQEQEQEHCPLFDWESYYQEAIESPPKRDCDESLTNGFFGREPKSCSCRNPLSSWNRNRHDKKHAERVKRCRKWQMHLLRQAQSQDRPVDVVFYGSSIMEQWMGAYYGQVTKKKKANAQAFEDQFGPNQSLYGLVMAMAGDTTTSLLYHIHTGEELPDWLHPKIIWITIGTNDLAHQMCSENSISLATMHLVREIKKLRPNAKIVLNSILPVGRNNGNASLWDDAVNKVIRQVNQRRECFAKVMESSAQDVYFFNATQIFVNQDNPDLVNATRFRDDFLHPSLEGFQAWGQAMAEFAQSILPSRH